ncbi:bifunctional DNA-formamidopyrimidine glycosylase/DNA-(apurinic or apyrimidinic site) lyase [Burkholderiaceae bacterium FT117]|uniref:bifunctional DNA-formamidopyrimidine glycosylase/DNA-(apurinic or apyrimidinic site) lyase n=1 Tax=Zeimonas sediminis TaxID=2944268 RepID=UPI0023430A45|nr:bifunctional DNA-formamidopyrimidine glycosylase/DNA-(apurinic or apyrimidinic site) lyase [Zeimonas sediminis]MCM5571788.1 bifunctional DNA-formamidopyrimidine glycosylase/DNA-(apurinic or apyrimidinic site) lyase [Zeimonas sediminis]
MPELPEVEVVRRGLQAGLTRRTVRRVEVRDHRLRWPVPATLGSELAGRRLESVGRRGKYLLMDFGGDTLIVHLGMSGNLRILDSAPLPARHDHVDIDFGGRLLRYHDPRRFGAMLWHRAADGPLEAHSLLAGLGVEPFSDDFDGAMLYRATRGRALSIKQLLLSGTVVVGVGNIYASESLFRAGIRPSTPARRVGRERCERLARAIRETLSDAIGRGGSSLKDFVGSDGQGGYFQLECFVYGRAGLPCRVCGTPVAMRRDQARATFWCPRCQS